MNKKERFIATVERKPVDKPASWLGIPVDDALVNLYKEYNVQDYKQIKEKVDDDIWNVELPYKNGTTNAIYAAFDFAKKHTTLQERTLTGAAFFEDYETPDAIELFDWPDPAKYINPRDCRAAVKDAPAGYAVMGVLWSAHFQDACAAFGMQDALVKMKTCPELFEAVLDRITDFYLKANGIFYEATQGHLDAVLIGNDFGTQTGLIISPNDIRKFVLKGSRKLIQQAKDYNLKVIYHSCGAVSEIIPDLIECGVDIIHPIQALASGMQPERLKALYGDKVSFCGGVDAQYLLVKGSPQDIRNKVSNLKALFPTGLVISPSHEAILPDVPPINIKALFESV